MSGDSKLNERGNHQGEFTLGVGGWAEYTVNLTLTDDKVRHDVTVPPGKVIPVIFLPGVMGSNLRMSKKRQKELEREDNRSWRPDDMVSVGGQIEVVRGVELGGWFKNATPAQRQLALDPNETEVEYYHYTTKHDRFDPEGSETLAADALHQNVPDSLASIPPLLGQRLTERFANTDVHRKPGKRATPAQLARWRGWSEILFAGAYGDMLQYAERHLNNMFVKGKLHEMWRPILKDPREMGATGGTPLTEADLKKISGCWYPVHAMGYNFLASNGDSAVSVAARIRGLVSAYAKRGFKCREVIIVTHSMGGLLARALIHPEYGNLLNDQGTKVLGIYHSVMPSLGAAATYKRMRFGFQESDSFIAVTKARIFGIDGMNTTAVLANAPGPLELLPGDGYGKEWLKVVDSRGKIVCSWPSGAQAALESIYLQPEHLWWRLINPLWVNPGNVREDAGGGMKWVMWRLALAAKFIKNTETTFHPSHSYASYCNSSKRLSYDEVVLKLNSQAPTAKNGSVNHSQEQWKLESEDGKGTLNIRIGAEKFTLTLQHAKAAGDETVPADRSARQVAGTRFIHGAADGTDYEHQESYSHPLVLESMLYSIVQIAKSADWGSP